MSFGTGLALVWGILIFCGVFGNWWMNKYDYGEHHGKVDAMNVALTVIAILTIIIFAKSWT